LKELQKKMKQTAEQIKSLQTEKHYRQVQIDTKSIDEESRTVQVAFSSEDPYERWWGVEVLGHGKGEVVMAFLESESAPALAQHNHSQQIGVITDARIDSDGKGRCTIRFSKGPLGEEYFQDVLDGIRKNISVGYMIHSMKLVEENDDIDTYRVTEWEPFEVSFVSVPADKTVGVGRSAEEQANTIKGKTMEPKTKKEDEPKVDVKKIETDTRQAEVGRIREIDAIGKEFNLGEKATEFIQDGKTVDQMRAYALEHLKKNGMKPVDTLDPNIGLNAKEAKSFSFLRAIRALSNPENRNAQEAAKFEFEASEAVASKLKKDARGIMVPMEVLSRGQEVADTSLGGNLVATDLMTGSFIDLLQNLMILSQMGITTLTGLIGDIAIPKLLTGYAAYWVDENADPLESAATFGQVSLAPKTVGARTELSRKFLLQSSLSAEGFARMQLAMALALELDRVGINGSGTSPEPRGILNTTGIGAVECGTNGAAMTWAKVVELWSAVATENAAVGATGFMTNSKVCGQLMTTEKATGTAQFVVKDFPDKSGFTGLAGGRCGVSNQIPSDLTKGTGTALSALIYGNFADLIMGMWGTLDLTIDPYSKAESGAVRVIALQDVDVAVKRPQSFSATKDILTA
jgi:HK97 family phage major capsid protein